MAEMPGTSKSSQKQEGEWTCADTNCSNVNFSWQKKCKRCGKGRQEPAIETTGVAIREAIAEKIRLRPTRSADNWECLKCGKLNPPLRLTCKRCEVTKIDFFVDRTGCGFNEFELAGHNHRSDSDDECDEFGRKKKQYQNPVIPEESDTVPKPKVGAISTLTESSSDNEDDKGGDLSKSDLSGLVGNADDKANEPEKLPVTKLSKVEEDASRLRFGKRVRSLSRVSPSPTSDRSKSRSPICEKPAGIPECMSACVQCPNGRVTRTFRRNDQK